MKKFISFLLSVTLALLIFLLQSQVTMAVNTKSSNKRIITYYADWSVYNECPPKILPGDYVTDISFAFLGFNKDGSLYLIDPWADTQVNLDKGQHPGSASGGVIANLQALKLKYPNVHLGVSLGGWTKSGNFSDLADTPTARANFVTNLCKFLTYSNFDYIDLDWEYPATLRSPDLVDNKNDQGTPNSKLRDTDYFTTLLQDLKAGMNKLGKTNHKKYELSIAIPAIVGSLSQNYNIKDVFNTIDYANLMSYDMDGAWAGTTGEQSALFTNPLWLKADPGNSGSIDNVCSYLKGQGVDMRKLNIGAPYYTRGWQSVDATQSPDPNMPGMFAPAIVANKDGDGTPTRGANNQAPLTVGDGGRAAGIWNYNAVSKLLKQGCIEYWDPVGQVPYLYNSTTGQVFTYDNEKSVQEKANYVIKNNLSGMIVWMASQDAPDDKGIPCKLTSAIYSTFYPKKVNTKAKFTPAPIKVSCTVKPFKSNTGKVGYTVSITNNEKLTETNVALAAVEKSTKTIKFPQVTITRDSKIKVIGSNTNAGAVSTKSNKIIANISRVASDIFPGKIYSFTIYTNKTPDLKNIHVLSITQSFSQDGLSFTQSVPINKK